MKEDGRELVIVLNRLHYDRLRHSALVPLRQILAIVEEDFQVQGLWIGGSNCSIANMHASWMTDMVFQTMDVEMELRFSERDSKVHSRINALPRNDGEHSPDIISASDVEEKSFGRRMLERRLGSTQMILLASWQALLGRLRQPTSK